MTFRRVVKTEFLFSICLAAVLLCETKSIRAENYSVSKTFSGISAAPSGVKSRYEPNEIIVKFRDSTAGSLNDRMSRGLEQNKITKSIWPDNSKKRQRIKGIKKIFPRFGDERGKIQALKNIPTAKLSEKENRLLKRCTRAPLDGEPVNLDGLYKLEVEIARGETIDDVLNEYRQRTDVEYAEKNYIVSLNVTPDDPLYSLQWPLNNTGQIYPETGFYNPPPGMPDADIDAPQGWDISTGMSDVVIAVIDTGVYYNQRDLQNQMWTNESELNGTTGVDDDENGFIDDIYGYDFFNNDGDPDDDHGHGTHCSGIIAADPNNGLDITGICWKGRIMAIKFLGQAGYGDIADAVEAIYYAVENGAEVLSNSWGSEGYSQLLQDAINYAHTQGVIFVAAAGNDNDGSFHYPAAMDNVIAVAATNSNDQKAPFSNYGDWVDTAAPGVDILSLRAADNYTGVAYDDYTSIASGTSMAAPHVAGAAALLISANPTLSIEEIYHIIVNTGDNIEDGICSSDTRINLFDMLNQANPSQGHICFDSDIYACQSEIGIRLGDYDLSYNGLQNVSLLADSGDYEILTLTEEVNKPGIFTGFIVPQSGDPNYNDGILQVIPSDIFTVIYFDADDGTGSPATVTDIAASDCIPPVITDVNIVRLGSGGVIIDFVTDEKTTGLIKYATSCGGTFDNISSPQLLYDHSVRFNGLQEQTDYYFIVEVNDIAGNKTIEDCNGLCCQFMTLPKNEVYVPADYNTIQQAIDAVWDGDIVTVSDGVYTGNGNRDIDFRGYAITVRSENGPNNCTIDCQAFAGNYHRAFSFVTGENNNSVLEGFTIKDGYAAYEGGALYCIGTSPIIRDCIFKSNEALYIAGAILNAHGACPEITDCDFNLNATISNGSYAYGGGAIANLYDCSPLIKRCTFVANHSNSDAGALYNLLSSVSLVDCTFRNNFTIIGGGGILNEDSTLTMTNCLFNGNQAYIDDGGAIFNKGSNVNIVNCTFSGNQADVKGGAIFSEDTNLSIINTILWANSADGDSNDMSSQIAGDILDLSYNCVQGLTPEWLDSNNIALDPLFIDIEGHDNISFSADDNLRLSEFSPCLDAGDNTAVPVDIILDLDGDARFLDQPDVNDTGLGIPPIVDMGAYEGPKLALMASENSLIITEGQSQTFNVTLAAKPDEEITVSVIITGDEDITVIQGAELTFDSENFYQPQIVIIAAVLDGDYIDGQATIEIASAGLSSLIVEASEEDNTIAPPVLFVDVNATGGNCGSSWTDAFVSLTDALDIAVAQYPLVEQIWVAEGTYKPAEPAGDQGAAFELLDGLALYGGFPSAGGTWLQRNPEIYPAILSGDLDGDDEPDFVNTADNSDNVVTGDNNDSTALLDGFVITAAAQSGMKISNGSPTVTNCTFTQNQSNIGGGICCSQSNSQFNGCRFTDNFANTGGGLFNDSDDITLTNCLFAGNTAENGGAIENFMGSLEMTNCTIAGNDANDTGGGIDNMFAGTQILINCIFWENSDNNGTGETSQIAGDVVAVNFSCIEGWTGGFGGDGNIGLDPLFAAPNDGDFHLKSQAGRWDVNSLSWVNDANTSPCIDAGDPNTPIGGELWPHGTIINMGLYGGTPQASLSESSAGNPADFNNDGVVNFADFAQLANLWLREDIMSNEDIDRNFDIDTEDFKLFIDNWLWQE